MEGLRFHESQNPTDPTGKTSPSKFCSSVFAEPDGEIGSRIPMDVQELIHGEAAEVRDITTAGSLERGLQGNSMCPHHILMSCKASTRTSPGNGIKAGFSLQSPAIFLFFYGFGPGRMKIPNFLGIIHNIPTARRNPHIPLWIGMVQEE